MPDIAHPGRAFRGEIRFLLDKNGYITKMNFRRSGIGPLDDAMKKAVEDAQPIPLPTDPKILEVFMVKPKIFYYDERDLP
ncbi:MAG: hypothetical protein C9356_09795 [Oleiphilus sp.]|nr:MAG: hypothetical protein C9356_09795 [Oleiphilus sp.]